MPQPDPSSPARDEDDDTASSLPIPDAPRVRPRTVVLTLASCGLVVLLLGWGLPAVTGAEWTQILGTVQSTSPLLLAGLLLVAIAAALLETKVLHAAVPGLRGADAIRTSLVAQALTTGVPAGATLAVGAVYAMLRRRGFTPRRVMIGITVLSLADLLLSLLLPGIGVLAYLLGGAGLGTRWTTVLVVAGAVSVALGLGIVMVLSRGSTVVALAARLQEATTTALSLLGRGPAPDLPSIAARHHEDTAALLARRGVTAGAAAFGVRVLQLVIMLVALQATGVAISLPLAIAVFALGRLLAMVPLTPSGTGVTEAGTTLMLVALGAAPGAAAAAMLLTTLGIVVVPVLLGVLAAADAARTRNRQPYGDGAEFSSS